MRHEGIFHAGRSDASRSQQHDDAVHRIPSTGTQALPDSGMPWAGSNSVIAMEEASRECRAGSSELTPVQQGTVHADVKDFVSWWRRTSTRSFRLPGLSYCPRGDSHGRATGSLSESALSDSPPLEPWHLPRPSGTWRCLPPNVDPRSCLPSRTASPREGGLHARGIAYSYDDFSLCRSHGD
jgi:hypothetical protein